MLTIHRGLWTLLLLTLWTLAAPLAQAGVLPSGVSEYGSFFGENRDDESSLFHLVEPLYTNEVLLFPQENIVPRVQGTDTLIDVSADAPFQNGLTYEIELPEGHDRFSFTFVRETAGLPVEFSLTTPSGFSHEGYGTRAFHVPFDGAGVYSFSFRGEDFDTYNLRVHGSTWTLPPPEALNDYFVVDPDMTFFESHFETLDRFLSLGGNVLVISNQNVARRYGVYFEDRFFEADARTAYLKPLSERTVQILDYSPPPSECFDRPDLPLGNDFLFVRFYCLRENIPSTLAFAGKALFDLDVETPDLESFHNRIREALAPIYPFRFPALSDNFLNLKIEWGYVYDTYASTLWLLGALLVVFAFYMFFPTFSLLLFRGVFLDETAFYDNMKDLLLSFRSRLRQRLRQHPFRWFLFLLVLTAAVWLIQEGLSKAWFFSWLDRIEFSSFHLMYVLGFLAALALSLVWLFPERSGPLKKSFLETGQRWTEPWSDFQCSMFAFVFGALSVAFLYRWLLSGVFSLIFLLIVLVFGGLLYAALLRRNIQLDSRRAGNVWRLLLLLAWALPLLVVFSSIRSKITLLGLDDSTLVFNATSIEPDIATVQPHPLSDTQAWVIPGKSLWLASPFNLNIFVPSFIDPYSSKLVAKLRSNQTLYLGDPNVRDRVFYAPALDRVSIVKALDTIPRISVYRALSAPSLTLDATPFDSWQDFVRHNIPVDRFLNALTFSSPFYAENFIRDEPALEAARGTLDVDLLLNPSLGEDTFYTVLTRGFELTLEWPSTSVPDSNLVLYDALSREVYRAPLSQGKFKKNGLPKGVYFFRFERECFYDCERVTFPLRHLRLNSGALVVRTERLYAPRGIFWFRPWARNMDFHYAATSLPFKELGGRFAMVDNAKDIDLQEVGSLAPQSIISVDLPLETGDLVSSIPLLYALTPESWFNPFQFQFSDRPETSQYWVVEDYDPQSVETESDGAWQLPTASISSLVDRKQSQASFQKTVEFNYGFGDGWVLLHELRLSSSIP